MARYNATVVEGRLVFISRKLQEDYMNKHPPDCSWPY